MRDEPVSGAQVSAGQTWERSLWRPIRDGNVFESTVERLAQAIKLGGVVRGERLPPERELADRLQVSRVTLREAIKALRDAGFVDSRRGRSGGTFVVYTPRATDDVPHEPTSADDLHDTLTLRLVVEPGAAAIAAGHTLSAAERALLARCMEASRDRNPDVRRVNDSRLHLAIAAATGSASVTATVADVQLRLDKLLAGIPVLHRNLDHSDEQHAGIVEAILGGNPDDARQRMEQHCTATGLLLEGLLT